MSNMSYCRFQNTAIDLEDCVEEMQESGVEKLSMEECKAATRLYDLCQEYIRAYEETSKHDDPIDQYEEQMKFEDDDPDRYKSEESERWID